jgi:uncharacterized integral membrane protein (TIGR00697 family)
MVLDARHKLFLVLSTTFVTCLIVGDLIGGKLISTTLFGLNLTTTVGMLPFPVTFLLTDLINEFYGKKSARFVTWVGFFMAALAFLVIYVAAAVPIAEMARAPGWTGVRSAAFDNVFLGSLRMLAASLVAYLTAQFVDIKVFDALRRLTREQHLWLRATGSTALSQMVDTVVINLVAWVGMMPMDKIIEIMLSAYVLKLTIAIGLTPLVYAGHKFVERGLGIRPFRADS